MERNNCNDLFSAIEDGLTPHSEHSPLTKRDMSDSCLPNLRDSQQEGDADADPHHDEE